MKALLALILVSSTVYAHSFSGTENVQVSFHTVPDAMPSHNQTIRLAFETFDKLGNRLSNIDYGINITRDGANEFHESFVSKVNATFPYTFYNGSYSLSVRVSPSKDYNGDSFPAMTVSYIATIGKSAAFAQGGVVLERNDTTLIPIFSLIVVIIGLAAVLKINR